MQYKAEEIANRKEIDTKRLAIEQAREERDKKKDAASVRLITAQALQEEIKAKIAMAQGRKTLADLGYSDNEIDQILSEK